MKELMPSFRKMVLVRVSCSSRSLGEGARTDLAEFRVFELEQLLLRPPASPHLPQARLHGTDLSGESTAAPDSTPALSYEAEDRVCLSQRLHYSPTRVEQRGQRV